MPTPVASRGLTADDVLAVVRDALAARPAAATAAAEAPPPPDDAPLLRAHEVLATAMADGRWSEDDAAKLRAEVGELSPEQLEDVFAVLVPAINSGRLRVDYRGPVL